ncbi:competence protein ComK [Bacillus alkalicellulosilyticus]|uniref:competence protein ComK n=1 Tax=Alkalihalobacterium alkalicellulosilyticum TaxID=1912214 RepID=UPI000995FEA0|nr:competence protein ComK [Bacillus alkalicellulosilyticus]
MKSDYIINGGTMALISVAHETYGTLVYECNEKPFYVVARPQEIINDSCVEGGANYEGRREAVMHYSKKRNKLPIPIYPEARVIAFPTHSPKNFVCSWIFYDYVKFFGRTHNSEGHLHTEVTFEDMQTYSFDVSVHVFDQQMLKASHCISRFHKNKFITKKRKKGKRMRQK